MEWITWEEYIQSKKVLSPEEAITMLEPIILDLQKMHRSGRCYGAVTPQAIMVGKSIKSCFQFSENDKCKISGLWKMSQIKLRSERRELINESTMPYLALEFYLEKKGSVASDIYGICAILYHAVTGIIPQTATKRFYRDSLTEMMNEKQTMSELLKQLLIKGMSLKPEERFQDITELLRVRVECQYEMGEAYYFGRGVKQDYEEAVKWYLKAAAQGHAAAQNNLGNIYCFGQSVEKNESEAVKWYQKAADQGYAAAQCNLGNCYYDGSSVKKNHTEAVKWYLKAAKQGHIAAQYNLGVCCEKGIGLRKNEKEAVRWYWEAANQKYRKAQYALGHCYEKGIGVKRNKTEAIKWYQKAAENEDTN